MLRFGSNFTQIVKTDYLKRFKPWILSFFVLGKAAMEYYQGNQSSRQQIGGYYQHTAAENSVWLAGRAVPAAAFCHACRHKTELCQGDQRLKRS